MNAKIESTYLGDDDHGGFTAWLNLSGDGWGQGFGGKRLSAEFIKGVCDCLKVSSWEKLPGQLCRIEREGGRIVAILHPIENRRYVA